MLSENFGLADKKMNLVFVADYYPLRGSGAFRMHDFVRFLISSRVKVSMVSRMSLKSVFKVKTKENLHNVEVYRAPSLSLTLAEIGLDVFQIITTFFVSLEAILQNNADVVIISVPPGIPGISGFFAAKVLRRKVVFDVRDKWEEFSINHSKYRVVRVAHVFLKGIFDVLYKKADLVISVTPSMLTYLRQRGAHEAVLIPNGADTKIFDPKIDSRKKSAMRSELGLKDDDVVLVYIGAFGGYYRMDVVIQAIYYLMDTRNIFNVKFLIMGKGEASKINEMFQLIQNHKLGNNIVFLGEKTREEVAHTLPCCDLGVVPYDDSALWTAAYSTKFFEYCSAGLPVIVTVKKDSDLGMLVAKHNVGYVVNPLDVAQFAGAIQEFYDLSVAKRKEMSVRARNLIVNHFDRQKTAQKLLDTLQKV